MKVIFIGSDRNILKEGSAARSRMIEYGGLFEELHIVVFTPKSFQLPATSYQLSSNVWAYPTKSWSRWFYPFSGARFAEKIIKNSKSETKGESWVISAQDPFEAGLSAVWASRKTGAKIHIQIHTDFLSPFFKAQSFLNILRLRIAPKVLSEASGIRAVSTRIKESLLQATSYKLQASPVVLPIYIEKKDLKNVVPYDYKKDHPDWNFTIISVGRLEAEKNFEIAIKTMNLVCQKYRNTGLVIIGEGGLMKSLKSLVYSLGLSKNVLFIDGWQKDLSPFYSGADLYLQSSNYEGFGLAAVEAAYQGLPVVTTDVGASGWLFINGVNSLICPIPDERCLSFEIIKLIENPQLRQKIIGNLKDDFGAGLIKNKADYLKKYKELIENCLNFPKSENNVE